MQSERMKLVVALSMGESLPDWSSFQSRLILALAAALLAADPSAPPSPPGYSAKLSYTRAAEAMACPDEQIVRSGIAQRLGYDPFDAFAAREVRARVRREGKGFGASVELF